MKKTLLLFWISMISAFIVNAQLTESFDGITFPPTGWTSTLISKGDGSMSGISGKDGDIWDRVTSGTFPTASPHSGAGMARYNSYDFYPSSQADLITPAMNFAGMPKRVSFWVYRSDNSGDRDSLNLYVNTTNSATGATYLGTIHRDINLAPVVQAEGWYRYYFDISAAFNGPANFIIFRGISDLGLNIFLDDIVVADQPTCKEPIALSINNYSYSAGTITANWTAAVGSPAGYQWAVTTTNTAPASGTAVIGTTASVTGITSNVINYLYVRSDCGGGDFSAWVSIAFAALPCATLTVPVTGATNLSQSPTFSWTAVTGADSYDFYAGTTPGNEVYVESTPATTATFSNFLPLPQQIYYWYVIPAIGVIASPYSACPSNSFATGQEANTPANNACIGATLVNASNIMGNPVTSTTVGATISLNANPCPIGGNVIGTADDDVWFKFTTTPTSPPSGILTITPLASGGIVDIVAQVYAATSCSSLGAPVACADLNIPPVGPEQIDLSLLAANTQYFMRVYSYGPSDAARGGFTITLSGGNTLPLSLINFTARRLNGLNILNWSTSQELNTRFFTIERSNDGINYKSIGQVNAAGNSNTILNYNFTDADPFKGINYYRLRTVDIDNSFKLSDIQSVRNDAIGDVSLYPNPVAGRVSIRINMDKAASGKVVITDLSGKTVYSAAIKINQGNTLLPIGVEGIAAGTYLVKIQLNNELIVKKFNKL